jgi:hypothetical protein
MAQLPQVLQLWLPLGASQVGFSANTPREAPFIHSCSAAGSVGHNVHLYQLPRVLHVWLPIRGEWGKS